MVYCFIFLYFTKKHSFSSKIYHFLSGKLFAQDVLFNFPNGKSLTQDVLFSFPNGKSIAQDVFFNFPNGKSLTQDVLFIKIKFKMRKILFLLSIPT